jgi:hypothetical protein
VLLGALALSVPLASAVSSSPAGAVVATGAAGVWGSAEQVPGAATLDGGGVFADVSSVLDNIGHGLPLSRMQSTV